MWCCVRRVSNVGVMGDVRRQEEWCVYVLRRGGFERGSEEVRLSTKNKTLKRRDCVSAWVFGSIVCCACTYMYIIHMCSVFCARSDHQHQQRRRSSRSGCCCCCGTPLGCDAKL